MERRLGVDPGLYLGLDPGINLVQKHRGSKFAIHENALPGRRGRSLTLTSIVPEPGTSGEVHTCKQLKLKIIQESRRPRAKRRPTPAAAAAKITPAFIMERWIAVLRCATSSRSG